MNQDSMSKRAVVAQIDDLQNGEMRQVEVDHTPVLLTRIDDQYQAMGAHCTHLGAPLAQGVLSGDRLICPWHNACFHGKTGDQLQPPGFDHLPCYEVQITGNDVVVSVPQQRQRTRTPEMATYDPKADSRLFAILGAGAAGTHAAEMLRSLGFQGRIVLITAEDHAAYDRTVLSKNYLQGKASESSLQLRSPEFYKTHDIECWTGRPVTQVDAANQRLIFADGASLDYDSLLVATGGKARQLSVPGADLRNIFTLRSYRDAEQILKAAKVSRAVVIGSSFIGMEAAAALTQQGIAVTVVSPESVPFEKTLGAEVGRFFQTVHEQQGVQFKLGTKADHFEGTDTVEAVVLDDGDRCPAELVVVGIGVKPATEILQGVQLNASDQSVTTDRYLRAADGLYAAGDIASFPDATGAMTRIEHWQVAAQQGRIAAHNMLGQTVPFATIPFFWTNQFDIKLRYVGHAESWDDVIVDGDVQEGNFLAFYVHNQQVLAVVGNQRNQEIAMASELMRLNQMPDADTLRQNPGYVRQQIKPN